MARAPIQGETLRWARESLHMDREELGRAANVSADRVAEFEEGEQPTFKQLLKLAGKLDRSAAFFFAIPPTKSDTPETVDFRGKSEDAASPLLTREIRRVNQYRQSFLELTPEWHETKSLDRITRSNTKQRAKEFRSRLGLTEEFAPPSKEPNQVFNFWKDILEQAGYLIFQTTRIKLREFRGFSISHTRLPIIVVNGSDAPNGKVFTLFHEIAHLANRTNGLCILDEDVKEEAIANSFAAEFLMPRTLLDAINARLQSLGEDHVRMTDLVAHECRVSTLAAGIRLKSVGRINDEQLQEIRDMSDENWQRSRDQLKSKKGNPPHWLLRKRDLGQVYVGSVTEALDDGRVSLLDATYLLNARLPAVNEIISDYRRNEGRE